MALETCHAVFLERELHVDAKRQLASVSAIVDKVNIVVFGPWESYIENTSIGQRIPKSRRKRVFVVQLDAQADTRSMKTVKFDEPNIKSVFRRLA